MILDQIIMAMALVLAHQAVFGPRRAVVARLRLSPAPRPGMRLWMHSASVGKATSARWMIEALLAVRPGLRLLVTMTAKAGRAQVQGWSLPGVTAA